MKRFLRHPAFHALLVALTGASVFAVFLFVWGGGVSGSLEDRLWGSGLFTGSVLLILGAHELGHYFMARAHGVDASLPYFIPVPFGFGTLGAVIQLRGTVPTRNALVDIGAAGPLAGLLIAVPLLAVGVWLSPVIDVPAAASHFPPRASLWYLAQEGLVWARATLSGLPAPEAPTDEALRFGDNLLTLLLTRVIHGALPAGKDLAAHPVLVASWFGLLVTMLNLLPVGQLDGGHLTHAWFGPRAVPLGRVVIGLLVPLSLFGSASWLVWFFLLRYLIKPTHPPVDSPAQPLSLGRKAVCVISFVAFALTFMPVPIDFV